MNKLTYINLFNQMYPNWFENEDIKNLNSKDIYEDMLLFLPDYNLADYNLSFDDNVTFGYFDGDRKELLNSVAMVDKNWQRFFTKETLVYCAFVNGEIASFCFEEDFGKFMIDGSEFKIVGPSCVGTIPKYRRKGIGLAMIANITHNFKKKGYDISYIHYTEVSQWYQKLGYKTILKWNNNGII